VQIECLIIGVYFIITRKVAALHGHTVHHLFNSVGKLQVSCSVITALTDPTLHRHFCPVKAIRVYAINSAVADKPRDAFVQTQWRD